MFEFPVTLTKDDNGSVIARFVDVPEVITFGADEDEALLNAIDALETGLSFYVDELKVLPLPSIAKKGEKTVTPSPLECAKLGIYKAMTEQGIKKAELARRLGWDIPQVDRLFDLRHASKIDQIEAAAHVLGKQINIEIA